MKNTMFTLLFFGFCFLVSGQSAPKVGDELIIKAPTSQSYHHINFPKPNILIKRGTVTRYKSVYGNEVVVNEVFSKDNGEVHVELKKKDGSKFFGFLSTVEANYTKAIDANEMVAAL